jgi:hypothetical protein
VIDSTERFGKVRIEIQNGEGAVLVLSDRLWGRKLRLSLTDTPIGKVAEGTVAVGVYDVSLVDGTSLVDGAGRPARISVGAGVESSYFLRKP